MSRKTLNLNSNEQLVIFNAVRQYWNKTLKEIEVLKQGEDDAGFLVMQSEGSKRIMQKLDFEGN